MTRRKGDFTNHPLPQRPRRDHDERPERSPVVIEVVPHSPAPPPPREGWQRAGRGIRDWMRGLDGFLPGEPDARIGIVPPHISEAVKARSSRPPMTFALNDTETNRLFDPRNQHCEILSCAVILVDGYTLEEVKDRPSRAVWHMQPRWPEALDPAAVAVNGYSHAKWELENPVTHRQMVGEFLAMIKGAIMFAQNVTFDRSFLNQEIARQGLEWTGHYHAYDLASLCLPLLWNGDLSKLKLATMCEELGIERHAPHEAFGDCLDMLAVMREARRRLLAGSFGER